MRPKHPVCSLPRFLSGLTEHVFETRLGIADPALVDYVSELICRFVRFEALFSLPELAGHPVDDVVDMVAQAEQRAPRERRVIHRHVGDFTLFWLGLYPDALQKLRGPGRRDCLIDYRAQGKRAYFLASRIEAESDREPPADLLKRLSVQFELCAAGLRQVRRAWENDAQEGRTAGPMLIS